MSDVVFSYADPSAPRLKRRLIGVVEAATGRRRLKRLYLNHLAIGSTRESFWQAAVQHLKLDVQFDRAQLDSIPKTGALVVVANHPFGVLDGLVISWLIEQRRPDFKVLTHSLLLRAPEARPNLLPVDFSDTPAARSINLETRLRAREHLKAGGCIVVFPAGAISTSPDRFGRTPATDAPWQPFTAQLVQRTRATVVPVRFAGQNSRLFQIVSHVSLSLRLALIFREVKNRIGSTVAVTIGAPVPFSIIERTTERRDLTVSLRTMVETLPLPASSDDMGRRSGRFGHLPRMRRRKAFAA